MRICGREYFEIRTDRGASLFLIDRYIARSIATPLLGTLAVAFAVLAIEELARLMSVLARTGAEARFILKMLAFLLPEYLALAIPISLLLGIFVAFRGFAQSAELDILCGAGFSFNRLLRIPCALSVLLAAASLAVIGFVEPLAGYEFNRLGFELDSGAAGASIRIGEFIHIGTDSVVRVDGSEDHGSRLIGIFLSKNDRMESIAATAKSGRFLVNSQSILLRLQEGRLVQHSNAFRAPRSLVFHTYDAPLGLPVVGEFERRGATSSELTLAELVARFENSNVSSVQRRRAVADFNGRLARASLMLLIPWLAVALAVPPKRSASSAAAIVGILVVVAFEKTMQSAVEIGATASFGPVVAIWGPFLVFSAAILRIYWLVSERPGGWSLMSLAPLQSRIEPVIQWLGSMLRGGGNL